MTAMTSVADGREHYAIVLAGGDGTRLYPVTRKMTGSDLPKQYCQFSEDTSLLESTYRRVSLSIPEERIFTVVNRNHERFYRPLLDRGHVDNLVIQPRNPGDCPRHPLLAPTDRQQGAACVDCHFPVRPLRERRRGVHAAGRHRL